MAFNQGFSTISSTELSNRVSEYDLVHYYLHVDKIPCVICSPLREDKKPSFSLYSIDGQHIGYVDFATKERGGTYKLLQKMYGITYQQLKNKIISDFGISSAMNNSTAVQVKSKESNVEPLSASRYSTTLEVKIRKWAKHDFEYWNSYGISRKWLNFGKVFPISHTIITTPKGRFTFPADKYGYVYVEQKDDKISLKVYQPFNTIHKWSNKHDKSVWDLWEQLPDKGPKLIITSSRKDALCLWANVSIPAVSLQAEGYSPKPSVVEELKQRFDKIYVLYDNDFQDKENYGRIFGKRLADEYGLTQIEIPIEYHSKDSSDLYHNHGKEVLIKVITELIDDN